MKLFHYIEIGLQSINVFLIPAGIILTIATQSILWLFLTDAGITGFYLVRLKEDQRKLIQDRKNIQNMMDSYNKMLSIYLDK